MAGLLSFLLGTKPLLDLLSLCMFEIGKILFGGIVIGRELIERILGALLEFFSDLLFLLVEAQTLATPIIFHFLQPSLLVRRESCLKTPLGMLVNLAV
jgi:hypothetical protein